MPDREPDQAPVDEMTQSEPLGADGERVDQQNKGPVSRGGGEFPDPDAPPTETAPGEPGVTRQHHGKGQFEPAYEDAPDDVRGTGALPRDDEGRPVPGDHPG